MPDLLTEEELLALEEQLLAQERPAILPQDEVAFQPPVEMPFIRPPGPSEEFLRRSQAQAPLPDAPYRWGRGVVESFNPETGVREAFSAISPPRSVSHDYLEQLRNQINNTKYATQAAANDAAYQFQAMRELIRLKEDGVPEHEAFYRSNPLGKPGSAAIINALKPTPPATLRDLGGGVRIVEGGDNTKFVPATPPPMPTSVRQLPVFKSDGTEDPDVYAVPSAGGRGVTVHRRAKEDGPKELTPTATERILSKQIEGLEQELRQQPWMGIPYYTKEKVEAEKERIRKLIQEKKDRINALVEPAGKTSERAPDKGYVIGKVYKGGLKYLGGPAANRDSWEKVP